MSSKHYDYVIIVPGNSFTPNFLDSWTSTLTWLSQSGYTYLVRFGYNPILPEIRNFLLRSNPFSKKDGLLDGTKVEPFDGAVTCSRVIFIDSDTVWKVQDFIKLIFTDKDYLTGVELASGNRENNRVTVSCDGLWLNSEQLNEKVEVFEIDKSGLCFASVSFDLIKNIEYPWFWLTIDKNNKIYGEDVYFSNKIKEAGYKMFCDPFIMVGHEKSLIRTIQ